MLPAFLTVFDVEHCILTGKIIERMTKLLPDTYSLLA